ncbi:ATPase [Microbacterium lacticum]|nr:ATPase [Microbacterium lacticum]MBF9336776.1 ATPase [Microbacterium lacticum]
MKSLLWFVLGLAGGFVAAHLVNKDPRGHEALVEVDARITEFTDRIGEAYRAQEAKIDGIAAEVKDAAANALGAAKDAAADAIDAAGDAASTAASAAKKTAAQLTD